MNLSNLTTSGWIFLAWTLCWTLGLVASIAARAPKDRLRVDQVTNAALIALLNRELWIDGQGHDEKDRAWRSGFNSRSRSLIKLLSDDEELRLEPVKAIGTEKR